ncbi:UNVERIFIED_CONTAM: PqqD family protein [Prevotella sp. 15_C9]
MKAKKGFNLRQVCGEYIIVSEGENNIDFSSIISMNESSAFLWQEVQKMESFTIDDLVRKTTEQYDVEDETARHDIIELVAQWGKSGIIEGYDIPETEKGGESELSPNNNESSLKKQPDNKKKSLFKRLFKN